MENNMRNNAKKHSKGVLWALVLFCCLLLCVILTFSFTLSYFGGHSTGVTGTMTLKAGIELKKETSNGSTKCSVAITGENVSTDANKKYFVPGTEINAVCVVTVVSGTNDFANTAVNGLLRVSFGLSESALSNVISFNASNVIVYSGTSADDMIEENIVGGLVKDAENEWYLTENSQITTLTDETPLYELDCVNNNGSVSIVFSIPLLVGGFENQPEDVDTIFNAYYEVIQSDFYNYEHPEGLPKEYKYAKEVFDASFGTV